MGLPGCGLGCVDDNVELCSFSGDPVGRYACEIVSASEISARTLREPVFLGAGPTTATLIRARLVVQVHPGPPKSYRQKWEFVDLIFRINVASLKVKIMNLRVMK